MQGNRVCPRYPRWRVQDEGCLDSMTYLSRDMTPLSQVAYLKGNILGRIVYRCTV